MDAGYDDWLALASRTIHLGVVRTDARGVRREEGVQEVLGVADGGEGADVGAGGDAVVVGGGVG